MLFIMLDLKIFKDGTFQNSHNKVNLWSPGCNNSSEQKVESKPRCRQCIPLEITKHVLGPNNVINQLLLRSWHVYDAMNYAACIYRSRPITFALLYMHRHSTEREAHDVPDPISARTCQHDLLAGNLHGHPWSL